MDPELKKALALDPYEEAEKVTGRGSKNDPRTEALGLHLFFRNNAVKDALLFLNQDTNAWDQTYAEWVAVVEGFGFESLLSERIEGTGDKLQIFWRNGILLFADSHRGEAGVNGATCYFNYRGPYSALGKCQTNRISGEGETAIWAAHLDAREGLKFNIGELESTGDILPHWDQSPSLWLLNYIESRHRSDNWEEINDSRIGKLPKKIQTAISPKPKNQKVTINPTKP